MAESRGYSTRKWSGLTNYKCDADECIYDSFDEDDLKRHVAAVHSTNVPLAPGPGPAARGRVGAPDSDDK